MKGNCFSQKILKKSKQTRLQRFPQNLRQFELCKIFVLKMFFFFKFCVGVQLKDIDLSKLTSNIDHICLLNSQKQLLNFSLISKIQNYCRLHMAGSQQYTFCWSPSLCQSNPLCRHILVYATFDLIFLPTIYSNTHDPKLSQLLT